MRTPSPAAAHTSRTMINFVMQTWLFLMTHAEIYIVFADFPMSASSSDTPSASVPPPKRAVLTRYLDLCRSTVARPTVASPLRSGPATGLCSCRSALQLQRNQPVRTIPRPPCKSSKQQQSMVTKTTNTIGRLQLPPPRFAAAAAVVVHRGEPFHSYSECRLTSLRTAHAAGPPLRFVLTGRAVWCGVCVS